MTPEKFVELRDRIARLNATAIAKSMTLSTAIEAMAKAEQTFTPPDGVRSAAARGLELRAKWKRGGLTNAQASEQGIGSGVQRATNLKNGDKVSLSTVKMMHAFFARHQKNYAPDEKESDGGPTAGTIAWLLWGGNAGKQWADGIVSRIQKDGEGGGGGDASASTGGSGPGVGDVHVPTTNWNGGASRTKKPKASEAVKASLEDKAKAHNEKAAEGVSKATAEALVEVYERGMDAYTTEVRKDVSQGAWAMARVNAFLRLLKRGKPENPNYTQDNDLLPPNHPANKE